VPEQFRIARAVTALEKPLARYSVAPSQQIAAVRVAVENGARELVALRWGLIPHWAKEPKSGCSTVNARAETVTEKPTYRAAFRHQRCIIPADGFYEWSLMAADTEPKSLP